MFKKIPIAILAIAAVLIGLPKTTNADVIPGSAFLTVIKHVVNDNSGTSVAADFTMTINGLTAVPSNSFPGEEDPGTLSVLVTNPVTLSGSYSVTESGPAGYNATFSADCSGTITLGDFKTCTVTNDDIAPTPPPSPCPPPSPSPPSPPPPWKH